MRMYRFWFGLCILLMSTSTAVRALENPESGTIILTITGQIKVSNHAQGSKPHHSPQAVFSLAMLQALPQHTITTTSPWVDTPHTYRGPKISTLLDTLQVDRPQGTDNLYLTFTALNNFQVKIEWDMIKSFDPILAWEDNGKVMTRREKGPIWLILPLDDAKLQESKYFDAMIWQIKEMEVLP